MRKGGQACSDGPVETNRLSDEPLHRRFFTMKYCSLMIALMGALLCVGAQAHTGYDRSLYQGLGVDAKTVLSLESHPAFLQYLRGASMNYDKPLTGDPVADYETKLPHGSQPQITPFERIVLPA